MSTLIEVTMTLLGPDGTPVPGTTATKAITAAGSAFSLGSFSATVSPTQIVFGPWDQPNEFTPGDFNGPVASHQGGWSAFTIDPSSNMDGFTIERIAVAGDTLRFDMQGLGFGTSTRLVINVAPA